MKVPPKDGEGSSIYYGIITRSLQAKESRKEVILNNPAAPDIFTRNGEFYKPGEKLVRRDLVCTFAAIVQNLQSFYTGSIARAIACEYGKKWWFNYSRRPENLQTNLAHSPLWKLLQS